MRRFAFFSFLLFLPACESELDCPTLRLEPARGGTGALRVTFTEWRTGCADGCGGPIWELEDHESEFPRCLLLEPNSREENQVYVISASATFKDADGEEIRYRGSIYDLTWAEEFVADEDDVVSDLFDEELPDLVLTVTYPP